MLRVRPAVRSDIPELVRLRELLFAELVPAWGAPPETAWQERCAGALAERLTDAGTRIAVIDAGSGLAACGMGALDRRLPSPYNPGGLIGHVFGVVTDPAHRGRGHARAIMNDLLGWFGDRGLRRVDLNASPAGRALYRSLGFRDHPDPTLSRVL